MYLFIKISETYLISWWIMDDMDLTSYNSISVISGDGGCGWSGGAMVLDKPVIPGHPTNLGLRKARPTALAVGAGGGCLDSFPSSINSLLFLSLCETARYRLKYCLKGPLSPKESTNDGRLIMKGCVQRDSVYG